MMRLVALLMLEVMREVQMLRSVVGVVQEVVVRAVVVRIATLLHHGIFIGGNSTNSSWHTCLGSESVHARQ